MRIHLFRQRRGCGCIPLAGLSLLLLLAAFPAHRQWRLRHHRAFLDGMVGSPGTELEFAL